MKKKLHIVLYLSYDCNLSCSYCPQNHKKKVINYKKLKYIGNFIKINIIDYEIELHFIGGEPLLFFDKIKFLIYFINNKNVKYSITTNGYFLADNNISKFLVKNINNLIVSFDEIYFNNPRLFLNNIKKVKKISNLEINFIYKPGLLYNNCIKNIFLILKEGYKNINLLPVIITNNYTKSDFKNLLLLIKYCNNIINGKDINFSLINFYNYAYIKSNIFTFSIYPDGTIYGEDLGNVYDLYGIDLYNQSNLNIKNANILEILQYINKFDYDIYLKNIFKSGKSIQNIDNFKILGHILYNN